MEHWKTIAAFPDYAVSDQGRAKRLTASKRYKAGKILKGFRCTIGYWQLGLTRDCVRHYPMLHRLVAQAFIPNPDNLPEVDHINRDKGNNAVSNLRWIAMKENKIRGQETAMAKLTEADVLHIRALLSEGFKQKVLAKMYSVDQSCICNINRRRNWAHI